MKPTLLLALTLVATNFVMGQAAGPCPDWVDGDGNCIDDCPGQFSIAMDCNPDDPDDCWSICGCSGDDCLTPPDVMVMPPDYIPDFYLYNGFWPDSPIPPPLDCTDEDYECASVFGPCIPNAWVCDTLVDCDDGSDEDDCGEDWEAEPPEDWEDFECTGEDYECSSMFGQPCIPTAWKCDGLVDCEDGSDEDETCGENWEATPFEDWYNRMEEAPIDVKVPAEARRRASAKAMREARVKARAEAVVESPVE